MSDKPQHPPGDDTHLPGADATELDRFEKAYWEERKAAIDEVARVITGEQAELSEAAAAVPFHDAAVPMRRIRDALHVPEDAGDYREGLLRILRRIPDGWGRWISCDAGWYPLLVELDQQLAELCPNYVVHQVKEKYGELCFYWALPPGMEEQPVDLYETMDQLVDAAERRSAATCEVCGGPDAKVMNRDGWLKTLDDRCAATGDEHTSADNPTDAEPFGLP